MPGYVVAPCTTVSAAVCCFISVVVVLITCSLAHGQVTVGTVSGFRSLCRHLQICYSNHTHSARQPARVTCHQSAQSVSSSRHHLEIHRFTRGGLNMHMSSIEISFIVGILPVPEIMLSSNQPSLACFPG